MATALGISYHMGWFCCAVVQQKQNEISIVKTGRVDTHQPGDLVSMEPYHVAGGWHGLERVPVPGKPEDIVKQGTTQQHKCTYKNLKAFLRDVDSPTSAAILVGRGRRPQSLAQALNSHAQIHMAEAHAVCDAIDAALAKLETPVRHIDRKTLYEITLAELGYAKEDLMQRLKQHKPASGPWRQEEKQSAIAAWLSLNKQPQR